MAINWLQIDFYEIFFGLLGNFCTSKNICGAYHYNDLGVHLSSGRLHPTEFHSWPQDASTRGYIWSEVSLPKCCESTTLDSRCFSWGYIWLTWPNTVGKPLSPMFLLNYRLTTKNNLNTHITLLFSFQELMSTW